MKKLGASFTGATVILTVAGTLTSPASSIAVKVKRSTPWKWGFGV